MPAERSSPPTVYAIEALLEGQPGAAGRVAWSTVERMALIAPGLYLAGFRGRQLARGTVAASLSITGLLIVYYTALANRSA